MAYNAAWDAVDAIGDAHGTPGTILTFFAWAGARRGIRGTGRIEATAFVNAPESVGYWLEHLKAHHVSAEQAPARFGEEVIRFTDPRVALLRSAGADVTACFANVGHLDQSRSRNCQALGRRASPLSRILELQREQ